MSTNEKIDSIRVDAWEVIQDSDKDIINKPKHICFLKNEEDAKILAKSLYGGYARKIFKTYPIYDNLQQYYDNHEKVEHNELLNKAEEIFTEEDMVFLGLSNKKE